jgi:cell division protein FtsB
MTSHRTSSIQRPITGEVTRPTRRRRRPSIDGTPGRGLPERPLPGRPGNVLRAPTMAAARPGAARRPAVRQPSTTVGRAPSAAMPRDAGPPTQAMPLTEPLVRKGTTDRRGGNRNRGSSRPAAPPRREPRPRPLAVLAGQPEDPPATRPGTPRGRSAAPRVEAPARRRPAPAGRSAQRRAADTGAGGDRPKRRGKQSAGPPDAAPRPAGKRRGSAARDGAAHPRPSALRDVTRPIARDSRMAERRPVRIGYGLIAATIGLALVAALVVLPVRRWWNQREDLADRRSELEILRNANSQLGNEVAALNTPEGIEAAARTDLNFGYPGEERTRSVGDPQAPIVLPPGFPYSMVTNLLAARTDMAATSPNPAGTTVAAGGATVPADPNGAAAADTTVPAATDPPEPTIAPPPGLLTPSP